MADVASFKYRAFLSYSHRDVGWAKRLHRRLESFRFDKDLIGRETSLGSVPKTLRPIFRDREDFSGGHTLSGATVAAIDSSAALIVLCSPMSATRPAVNDEVRLFRSRHADRPVIPVTVEGTWPDNFPPALRFELAEDGSVTDHPITILGPDLRKDADGKNLGLAKIVAGLTGLSPDDVFRRAERARRKRLRVWAGIAGFCLLLAVLATGSAVYAWHELKTNEAFLNATLKTATDIVNAAVAQGEKYNVPRAVTLELLTNAEGLFDNMTLYGRPTPELQYQKAWMLIQFARNYALLGDDLVRRARAAEANHIMRGLVAEDSQSNTFQDVLAVTYEELGDALAATGDRAEAQANYQAAIEIVLRRASANPDDSSAQFSLSRLYDRTGQGFQERGNLGEALKRYNASFAITERLTRRFRSSGANAAIQRNMAILNLQIGGILQVQGNYTEAMQRYRAAVAIIEELAASDPKNSTLQRDMSVLYEQIGSVLLAQGDRAAALKSFHASLSIREHLVAADPDNVQEQFDLVLANWNLAALGDEPTERRALVVKTMCSLRKNNRLGSGEIHWMAQNKVWLPELGCD